MDRQSSFFQFFNSKFQFLKYEVTEPTMYSTCFQINIAQLINQCKCIFQISNNVETLKDILHIRFNKKKYLNFNFNLNTNKKQKEVRKIIWTEKFKEY